MTLGRRIRELRQRQGWTQVQLGERVEVHPKQISAYERDLTIPKTPMLIRLAEQFDVTLDYLAAASPMGKLKEKVRDRELLERCMVIDELPEADKDLAKTMLDLVIFRRRFRDLSKTFDTGP